MDTGLPWTVCVSAADTEDPLAALVVAITLSMVTRINVGLVGLVLAWIVGTAIAGLPIGTIIGGFPTSLFITLVGMTLLFAAAEANGTIEQLARRASALHGAMRASCPCSSSSSPA